MFQSKVVLVTGSSSGIGAATAIRFAAEGAAGITLHGRNEAALKTVKEQVEKAGKGKTKIHVVVGDTTQEDTQKRLIDETIKQFGKLDVLVNNAAVGMTRTNSIVEATMDTFDQQFNINVRAVVALTQLAIPHLIKSQGNIVNISSIASVLNMPQSAFYAMTKAAIDKFTRCLAVDLGPQGVRVNGIHPGAIPTEFATRLGWSKEQSDAYYNAVGSVTPARRTGKPEEIADAILDLASDHSKYITGVIVTVDGGLSLGGAMAFPTTTPVPAGIPKQ